MSTSVNWYGPEIIKAVNIATKDAVMSAVLLVQNDATLDVNVDTGRHRASISGAVSFSGPSKAIAEVKEYVSSKTGKKQMSTADDGVEKPQASAGQLVGIIGSNVDYAIYRELDRPSLTNALEKNAGNIQKLFNGALVK